MIVMKFGGSSVSTGERIANVARIAAKVRNERGTPPVVVVSAMGGVTDSLVRAAESSVSGDARTYRLVRDELQQRHEQAIVDAGIGPEHARGLRAELSGLLDWFETLCQSMHTLGEVTPRGLGVVSGLGERLSARITAAAMLSQGLPSQTVEATDVIVTTANFGGAEPIFDATTVKAKARLLPLIADNVVPVVTGFIGATADGVPTTLGRGGSDYSATILGRCLSAEEVWIWTDVDGVMTADPRIVPEARTLPSISFGEVAELSYFGAKVLHPKTIEPVARKGIPVRVLNSFHPDRPGTLVCPDHRQSGGQGDYGDPQSQPGHRRGARDAGGDGRGGTGLFRGGAQRRQHPDDHPVLIGAEHLLRGAHGGRCRGGAHAAGRVRAGAHASRY